VSVIPGDIGLKRIDALDAGWPKIWHEKSLPSGQNIEHCRSIEIPFTRRSGYNIWPMSEILNFPDSRPPDQMDWPGLVSACARDRGNSLLWSAFVRRYGPKIRQFIRGTWRVSIGSLTSLADVSALAGGMQESDLFQSTIVRLVEDDCAALRRFSGTTEDEWLAYLAVITRSVVRDSLRRQRTLKRPGGAESLGSSFHAARRLDLSREGTGSPAVERELLGREVRTLCERTINNLAGESSTRDMLIFRLYFDHDLTARQIAQCRGVNLSKAGVEKVITRLKEHIRSVVSLDASRVMMQ